MRQPVQHDAKPLKLARLDVRELERRLELIVVKINPADDWYFAARQAASNLRSMVGSGVFASLFMLRNSNPVAL